jgi:ABC-type hemin transport system substrate-binding protein
MTRASSAFQEEATSSGGPTIAVCDRGVAEVLVRLGATRNIVAADRESLLIEGLMPVFDLGRGCRDGVNANPIATPDVLLSLGRAPGHASQPFKAWHASESLRLLELEAGSLDDIVRVIQVLGRLVDRQDRAGIEIAQLTRALAKVAVLRDGLRRQKIVWVVDDDPLTVVGATGLLHELLELAGAENAFHDTAGSRFRVDVEEILDRSPDLILVPEGDKHLAEALGPLVRILPQALLEIPTLDPVSKVQALHALLYAEDR